MQKYLQIFLPAICLIAGLVGFYVGALALGVDTVSLIFLLGCPLISGFVILYFRPKNSFRTFGGAVVWLLGVMLLAIFLTFGLGFEGMICVAMAIVPVLIFTLLGGVFYLIFLRWRSETNGAVTLISFPLIALAIADMAPVDPVIYEISTDVVIDAPAEAVFAMLKTIEDIQPAEVPTRLPHLLGVPKPTSAVWSETEEGALRQSRWGPDVQFHERITKVVEGQQISWVFEFPEDWAAEGIEDPHIKVGGDYFDILSGGYRLEDLGGKTRLSLTTRTYDNSGFGAYAKFWHEFFFGSFHEVILAVVKTRSETAKHDQPTAQALLDL
ncbi:MAG: polyketide cyclase/dehydrase [Thalassovita sp.]